MILKDINNLKMVIGELIEQLNDLEECIECIDERIDKLENLQEQEPIPVWELVASEIDRNLQRYESADNIIYLDDYR